VATPRLQLIIAGNRLNEYPPQLELMKDLHTLDLSMNELTELSFNIGSLTKLENLKANANALQSLPKRMPTHVTCTEKKKKKEERRKKKEEEERRKKKEEEEVLSVRSV
jgi:Leucine-rich repeat (LRR) protein